MAHVPERVIAEFSKRGVAISELLEGFGFDPHTASRAQRMLAILGAPADAGSED